MVTTELPFLPPGSPSIIEAEYATFRTAEAFAVPTIRVVAQGSRADWFGRKAIPYVTSESDYWTVSAADWERVLDAIRLLKEPALTTPGMVVETKRDAESPRAYRMFPDERRFLEQNWATLRNLYRGRFVAVLGTSILDSDVDFSALAERVYRRFGYRRIFMPFIGGPRRVYRIPSPRIVR